MKFAFVRDHRSRFDVDVMCAVLGVTPAGFYAWLTRPPSARAARVCELQAQIKAVHADAHGIYGSLKITREMRHRKTIVNRKTVAKLMKQAGIRSKTHKRFRVQTTDSNHANAIAPNVLDQDFARADALDKVWGVDITYITTREGFLFLAGVMDLCSRRIIGWSMGDSMTTDLVAHAMHAALSSRKPAFGLLHHSDRGVQYTSARYRELLATHGIESSMSRAGNCYDNAMVESFWGKLKTELVHHEDFATKSQARAAVFDYIESFYNRKRLHASLNYQSPEQFEASKVG